MAQAGLSTILGATGVTLTFSTGTKADEIWQVRNVELEEAVSTLYWARIELGSDELSASAAALLGESASLTIDRDHGSRVLHGIVEQVKQAESSQGQRVVRIVLVPALAALDHISHARVFEKQTVIQVIETVINGGLEPFKRSLQPSKLVRNDYPQRELIVQHRETDLAFVQRLLAEEGLWYYFRHPEDSKVEQLFICDSPKSIPAISDSPEVELSRDWDSQTGHEAITAFNSTEELRTTTIQVRQYNWTNPGRFEEMTEHVKKPSPFESKRPLSRGEHGDLVGSDYAKERYGKFDVKAQALLRLEAWRADRHTFSGKSNVLLLQPGHFFKLDDVEYLVLQVAHQGNMVVNGERVARYGDYTNSFVCLKRELPYRPHRIDKPRIAGIQTATVIDQAGGKVTPETGAQGNDIATDEHGRVRVKFHWDTTPAGKGGTTSGWVRVAQSWAGAGWGSQFVPRVGMEVVIQFIDGDVDQPLVTGCVYNGENPPPYAKAPTQSGIKTQSSIKPGDYNELRFDDAAGHEQIYVRAQKDYVEDVLNDHTTTVTGKQTQVVKKSQTETVNGSATLSVGGKRTKTVGGEKENGEEITIKGERKTTITKKHTEIFQDEHEVTVTKAVKENYLATHERTVTETQTLEAKADKLEHVVGSYELTTDQAYVLNQAATKLTLEGGKVALDAAGAISVTRGPATIDIDDGGNIAFKTTGAISFEVGPNKITISMSGIELESPAGVSAKVAPSELALTPASASMKSVNTTVEASAVCSIKGTAMVGLNS